MAHQLLTRQMELIDKLRAGETLIAGMEKELCEANEGRLPDPLPEKYENYVERYRVRLEEYGQISRQLGLAGKSISQIHFHAICEYGNAVYAWVAVDREGYELHREVTSARNEAGGHPATYRALLNALTKVDFYCWSGVKFLGCNQLVVNQLTGKAECSAESLIPLKKKADELLARCEGATVEPNTKELNRAVEIAWNEYKTKFAAKKAG